MRQRNSLTRRLDAIAARLPGKAQPDTWAMLYAFSAWLKAQPEQYDALRQLVYAETDIRAEAQRRGGLSWEETEQLPEAQAARERWERQALQYIRQAGMHEYADLFAASISGNERK